MRAPSSRNAAARRSRLSRSFAGVMSASYVARGKPCSPAASAPMSTNCTSCCASVLRIRLGSSGATGARSGTAGMSEELAQILDLFQVLLGRHGEDTGHLVQHVRPHHDARLQLRAHVDVGRVEQPAEGLPGRAGLTRLDARDNGLGGAGPARDGALAETGTGAGLAQQGGGGGHVPNDSLLAIAGNGLPKVLGRREMEE